MVVEARELASASQGYGSDAEDLLPLDDAELMPDGGDEAALSDPAVDPAAASAAEDAPEAEPLTEETWQTRERELTAQHNQQLSELRSVKDREIASANEVRAHAQAREELLWQTMERELAAIRAGQKEPDPRDLYALRRHFDQIQSQTMRQRQQTVQTGEQWVQRQQDGHHAKMAELSVDPESKQRLFDPNDPRIAAAFQAHLQAGGNDPQAWTRYVETIRDVREEGVRKALTGQQARARAQANRQRAQQRGAQNTSRGGGAAATSLEALQQQAAKEYPDDRNAAYVRYLELKSQQRKR